MKKSSTGNNSRSKSSSTRSTSGKTRSSGASARSRRGFASMDPKAVKEIASMGGRAAHKRGTAHEFSSAEARRAARERWD